MLLDSTIQQKILDFLKNQTRNCGKSCHNFHIMRSPYTAHYYFARYTRTDTSNLDYIDSEYRWHCFDLEGNALDCEPIFHEFLLEKEFKGSMMSLYTTQWIKL